METFYFTCGQSHLHLIEEGVVWDKDSVLQVNALNSIDAKRIVIKRFGLRWSMQYTEKEIQMDYYPDGICAIINE